MARSDPFEALLEELRSLHEQQLAQAKAQRVLPRESCESEQKSEGEEVMEVMGVDAAVAEELPKSRRLSGKVKESKELPTLNWEEVEAIQAEPEADKVIRRLGDIFLGPQFEFVVALLLIINLMVMALQLQYHGFRTGYELGYPRYETKPEDDWPGVEGFFLAADVSFAVIFTLEMLVRLLKIRWAYFKNAFNWIDFLVVCSSWAELWAAALPISPTFLRMLRLGKLLRAVRVVKMSQVLESLQLLLKCIYASLRILFWSLVLLLIIQCSAGIIISYMLSDYMTDESQDSSARFKVFRYYGTFSKTLLTMFEVLFANWAPACRVLIDNVSEWYSLVFIFYRCFVGFAVLNVVNAVFVQSTMKVAQADEELVAKEKSRTQDAYQRRITALFRQVDTSGDGIIDSEEFGQLLKNPKLQLWLHQLEIETNDLVGLFNMLDDGDGEISLEEFEAGILKIKGMARSYDVTKVLRDIARIGNKLDLLVANSPYTKNLRKPEKKRLFSHSTESFSNLRADPAAKKAL